MRSGGPVLVVMGGTAGASMPTLEGGAIALCGLCVHAWGGRVAESLQVRGGRFLFFAVREQGGDNFLTVAYATRSTL